MRTRLFRNCKDVQSEDSRKNAPSAEDGEQTLPFWTILWCALRRFERAILRRVLKRIDSSLRQVFPVTFLLERKGLALDDEDVFDAIAEKVLSRRRTRSRENGVRQ